MRRLRLSQPIAELSDHFATPWSRNLAPHNKRSFRSRNDLVVFIDGDLSN
jgi:hypothetical protein